MVVLVWAETRGEHRRFRPLEEDRIFQRRVCFFVLLAGCRRGPEVGGAVCPNGYIFAFLYLRFSLFILQLQARSRRRHDADIARNALGALIDTMRTAPALPSKVAFFVVRATFTYLVPLFREL